MQNLRLGVMERNTVLNVDFGNLGQVYVHPYYQQSQIILDKSTRTKHLSKFPMDKYITFRCVMNHLGDLPDDIIKYMLYIIIGVDKIDFRLRITEFILSYFIIDSLNIQFPLGGNLPYEAIHEAMIFKIFHIALMYDTGTPYKEQYWGNCITIDYNNKIIQTQISKNSEYQCVCCKQYSCKLYNHVPICVHCINCIESKNIRKLIGEHFADMITFPNINGIYHYMKFLSLKIDLTCYQEFENLIPSTYYNYLEYDFPQANNDKFPVKVLRFVSRQTQQKRLQKIIEISKKYEEEVPKFNDDMKFLTGINKHLKTKTCIEIIPKINFIQPIYTLTLRAQTDRNKRYEYTQTDMGKQYKYDEWIISKGKQKVLNQLHHCYDKWLSYAIEKSYIQYMHEQNTEINTCIVLSNKFIKNENHNKKKFNDKFNNKFYDNKYKNNIQKCGGEIMQPRCRGKY